VQYSVAYRFCSIFWFKANSNQTLTISEVVH